MYTCKLILLTWERTQIGYLIATFNESKTHAHTHRQWFLFSNLFNLLRLYQQVSVQALYVQTVCMFFAFQSLSSFCGEVFFCFFKTLLFTVYERTEEYVCVCVFFVVIMRVSFAPWLVCATKSTLLTQQVMFKKWETKNWLSRKVIRGDMLLCTA